MAVSLEEFVQQLEASGLLSGDELQTLLQDSPADVEQLASELVRQQKLTSYQVEQIRAGQGQSLVLGNYVVLDKLGQGGMGMVLKARHRRMDRIVAIKVMSTAAMNSPEAVQRFHREVKAAAKLEHPNIVAAYDADESRGTHFLVMQFIEGTDLSALVKRKGPLSVEQAVTCVSQAAKGLEFAHHRGVIHRDIKPANLLIDNDGVVKILDMGLARIEGEVGAQAELTSTGAVMGTVDYMAPEQAISTKHADARSDVYSLGITLWYLLAGRSAYHGDTLMARLLAHRDAPIPSLCAERPEISAALDAVFRKMVAKQPADRYQSMAELLVDLDQLQVGSATATYLKSPLAAEYSAGGTRVGSMTTRPFATAVAHTATDATAEATVLAGAVDQLTDPSLVVSGPTRIAPPSTTHAEPVKKQSRGLLFVLLGVAAVVLALIGIPFFTLNLGDTLTHQSNERMQPVVQGSSADPAGVQGSQDGVAKGSHIEPPPVIVESQQPPHRADANGIPEPSALDGWMKERLILTVAKDGSGQYLTIQSALDALQPGQAVKVLDRGPYHEVIRATPPPDTGLISEVKTIIEVEEWPAAEHALNFIPHGEFRLHGFRIQAKSREGWFHVLNFYNVNGVVIENCSVGLTDPTLTTPCLSLGFHFGGEFESSPTNWVRDCVLERNLGISPEQGTEAVAPPMVIERNLFRGGCIAPYHIELQKLVIRHNVFDTAYEQAFMGLGITGVRESLEILNNTGCPTYTGDHTGFAFFERPPPSNVTIRNNVTDSSVICGNLSKEDRAKLASSWQCDHNSYFRVSPKTFTSKSDIVGPKGFLSIDPRNRDVWRIPADSPLASGGVGGDLPSYIGALPPGPAPKEGDWFTKLRERWVNP